MKKKLRKLFAILFAVSLTMGLNAWAGNANASILLDGSRLNAQAVLQSQQILLPVRAIAEAMGYQVTWAVKDGISTAELQKGDDRVTLDLTNGIIQDNGHHYYAITNLGSGIQVLENRTYMDSGLFVALLGLKSQYDAAAVQVALRRVTENSITITTEQLTSQQGCLKTTIQYPQVMGLANSEAQDTVNALMKKAALDAQSEGQENAKELEQWIKDENPGFTAQCETYFDYAIPYNQNGLLSIILTDYQYAGGAHGSTIQSSYTFDLSTGKMLSLSDLMERGSGYSTYLNSAVRQEIDKRVTSGDLVEFDQKFSDLGTDPAYYLSNDGIVFYFQQYEYFPYAAGIQEFTIPYSNLKDMLKQVYSFLYSDPEVTPSAG